VRPNKYAIYLAFPLPGPFTTCSGVIRGRWPMLPWDSGPSRGCHRLSRSEDYPLMRFGPCLQAGSTRHFRVLRNNQPESLPKKKIHPSWALCPSFSTLIKRVTQLGLWIHLIHRGTLQPSACNLQLHRRRPEFNVAQVSDSV